MTAARNFDRVLFVCLYRIAPRILDTLTIVQPETVLRWQRAGFRCFWRWKSRRRAGRPSITPESLSSSWIRESGSPRSASTSKLSGRR